MEFPTKLFYDNLNKLKSVISPTQTTTINDHKGVLYATLTVLGHSQKLTNQFQLRMRSSGNGVVKTSGKANLSASTETLCQRIEGVKHSKSSGYQAVYQMLPNRREVVEYRLDPKFDLIQIGRVARRNVEFSLDKFATNSSTGSSELSRFACRLLADRSDPTNVRIFAAGFDDSLQIFLGENAHKWYSSVEPDGFITNGVRMATPILSDCDSTVECSWAQLSVEGNLYPLDFSVKTPLKCSKLPLNNQLIDGTLIELSGVTLLFRFDNDVTLSKKQSHLAESFAKLRKSLKLLHIVDETEVPTSINNNSQAYVYTTCGHVQGCYNGNQTELNNNSYECCLCRQTPTNLIPLKFAKDPQIHTDTKEDLQFCFNPCGHVVSLQTAKFWSQIPQPNRHTGGFTHNCPFCNTQLDQLRYIRLLFQS